MKPLARTSPVPWPSHHTQRLGNKRKLTTLTYQVATAAIIQPPGRTEEPPALNQQCYSLPQRYLRVLVLVKADLADVVSGSCSSGKTPAFTPVGRWHCSTSFIVALPISLYSFFNFYTTARRRRSPSLATSPALLLPLLSSRSASFRPEVGASRGCSTDGRAWVGTRRGRVAPQIIGEELRSGSLALLGASAAVGAR